MGPMGKLLPFLGTYGDFVQRSAKSWHTIAELSQRYRCNQNNVLHPIQFQTKLYWTTIVINQAF